ncbi:hypothetical protein CVT24_007230 [Panaeolus cyanescens]|uniref:Uncharacterized protein n=1 Tax=Panaeolus cyanescens TaxID=181874 RepID=A0A409YWS0_9AGAR|nr:hypothetical protein CVT24_007230 [Panaeolus cyanescens]
MLEKPEWFLECMKGFTEGATGLGLDGNRCLGENWVVLVHMWSGFQQAAGFLEDSKLPMKNRPFPIKEWIASPEWRKVDEKVDPKRVEGDWSALRLPGLNGLVSVVAALLYWSIGAHSSKAHTFAWSKAVRDCTTALTKITSLP